MPLLASSIPASEATDPREVIRRCLEHVWERFRLRARLFLLDGEELVLTDCVGCYERCPTIGLKVHPGSVVWEAFHRGLAANLEGTGACENRPHSLPDPVSLKALIPLNRACGAGARCGPQGVLVVDTGDCGASAVAVDPRDFQYLEVLGLLIGEILERSALQQEKDRMTKEVAHVFRNRFTVIGGYARRLARCPSDPTVQEYARIILQETEAGETAVRTWDNL